MRKYIGKFVTAAALTVLLAGCMTVGTKIDPSVVSSFQPGVTTMNEVKAKLGEPSQTTSMSDGGTQLVYSFAHSQSSGSSFIPVVGAFVGQNNTESQVVEISFDRKGKFTRSSVTSGNSKMGYQ